jgi:hypothetical protein
MAGRTLYLRNVPLDVVERLERLAEPAGLSRTAFAVREMAETSRREENAALFDMLPDTTVSTEEIVAALATERPGPQRPAGGDAGRLPLESLAAGNTCQRAEDPLSVTA